MPKILKSYIIGMLGFDHVLDSSASDSSIDESDNDWLAEEQTENCQETDAFLKHVRMCFISTDKEGNCEKSVMPDMKVFRNRTKNRDHSSIMTRRIQHKSYDCFKYPKYIEASRPTHAASSQQITLNEASDATSAAEANANRLYELLNSERDKEEIQISQVSLVTEMIRNPFTIDTNPFFKYSQFEAVGSDPSTKKKKIRIFLFEDCKSFMDICVNTKTALVSDLIGLICFKYRNEKRQPELKYESADNYALFIADETGEVDIGLNALDADQKADKYGFQYLGLVEREIDSEQHAAMESTKPDKSVKIKFMDETPDLILDVHTDQVSMREVFEKILEAKMSQDQLYCPRAMYRLEHVNKPDVAIDVDNTNLSNFETFEFLFFRENSSLRSYSISSFREPTYVDHITETKTFELTYIGKHDRVSFIMELSKYSMDLTEKKKEITGQKINYYTIPIESLVDCSTTTHKGNKAKVRLIIAEQAVDSADTDNNSSSPSLFVNNSMLNLLDPVFKYLLFECEIKVAKHLDEKIHHLINFWDSAYSAHYLKHKSKINPIKWSRQMHKLRTNR